ncbi:MAG: universal stress protein [Acidobacteriales bacterium]|nr:universal stress protein [Terriglobales bacterium]
MMPIIAMAARKSKAPASRPPLNRRSRRGLVLSLKHVMAAVDVENPSTQALEAAARLAERFGATLHVVHVVPHEKWILTEASKRDALRESAMAKAAIVLEKRVAPLRATNKKLVIHLVGGDVITEVEELVRAETIDLLALESSGRTGVDQFLLGSVAEELFRSVACAVMTFGPKAKPLPEKIQAILCPTDLSAASRLAGDLAVSFAVTKKARLVFLHVRPGRSESPKNRAERSERLEKRLLLELPLEQKCCPAEFAVEYGSPSARIMQTAIGRRMDLIIMGVKQAGPFGRATTHIPWATAYHVVTEAPCPVITVRAH